ncbi:MAG TPA: hypothetical protein ENK44_13775 [Caldithrix abyssi]|uniref:Uncharacterized protein n=1 Tax=Caldithrix abyssi TaxID=187145 RepID=A0A7V4U2D0_CALAY|nr:hypothetical protein [Caldithrix abyssi]
MHEERGKPSTWLLRNSKGFPDFLFTILTYSMILLIFVSLVWIAFAVLSFIYAGKPQAVTLLKIMESMKTGLISLAGVIFGLAGSYTVRRFKKDDHYVQKMTSEFNIEKQLAGKGNMVADGLKLVDNSEDI